MALPTYLTLDQMLKKTPANRADQASILMRFRQSPLLDSLTFETRPGQAFMQWEEVTDLPATQKRGLNEDFTAQGGGRSEVNFSPFKIYGVPIRQDWAADDMGLSDPIAQNAMAAKSMRLQLEYDFVYGDPTTAPKGIVGLQYYAENSGDTTNTSISAGTTSGGAALSLYLFRTAIDECVDPQFIVLSQKMQHRFTGAKEDTGISGYITEAPERFGRKMFAFDGLPFIPLQKNASQTRLLDFTEAASTGGSTATSIYIVGRGYRAGQNRAPYLANLAQTGSQVPRELRWLLANKSDRYSVVRVKHIGNLAMVA